MSQPRVSQAVTRPARTAVQGGLAFAITELLDSFGILPMDERQYAAVLLILTIVLGAVQAAVENRIGKGFLRPVPPTDDPVPGK
ncbi:MAG: hypothetical protein HOV78_11585 [Hamadaea sp.]|nr:hypothetical protein [Hamadaea sp.]